MEGFRLKPALTAGHASPNDSGIARPVVDSLTRQAWAERPARESQDQLAASQS